jgi:hypothetical protein
MRLRLSSDLVKSAWKVSILLPLVGVLFWLATGWMSQRVLSQTHASTTQLQSAGQHKVDLSFNLTIVSIDAEINHSTQITEVSIRTIGSSLEEMEFKFPVTEFEAIEKAIAQELGLAVADIHNLIRYRVD